MNHKEKRIVILALAMPALLCAVIMLCRIAPNKAESKHSYTDQVYPLERNGIDLYLDCMKADGVKVKDHILLVHGLTYSSHEFDVDYQDYSLVRFLCDNGYAVWRIDISGYGQSEKLHDGFTADSRYASEDICHAIDKILEITGAKNLDLLGWSWGTVTSSLAQQKQSEKIDKLILYAPILSGLGRAGITDDYHENSWKHAASDFQINADGSINESVVDMTVVHIYCSNCWNYDSVSPNGGRRDLCVDPEEQLIDLNSIKRPTLVICGDKDPYMNMPLVEDSVSKLPEGSKLEIIEGASHVMYLEKPYYHLFQNKLIDFLTDQ